MKTMNDLYESGFVGDLAEIGFAEPVRIYSNVEGGTYADRIMVRNPFSFYSVVDMGVDTPGNQGWRNQYIIQPFAYPVQTGVAMLPSVKESGRECRSFIGRDIQTAYIGQPDG